MLPKLQGLFFKKNMFVSIVFYPSPKSTLKPRGRIDTLNKMERFVIRKLEETYNFLGKPTVKPETTVYGGASSW